MKRRQWIVIGCLLALFGSASSLSAQVDINVSLDTADLLIGDHVKLSVQLVAEPGTEIETIDYSGIESSEGVEILDMGRVLTVAEQPQLLLEQEIMLTSYDSGYHRIEPLAVIVRGAAGLDTIYSNDLAISVNTIPVGEDDPLQANKDIIEEPVNWRDYLPYVLGIFGVLLVIALAWFFARRRSTATASVVAPPPPPPHEVALKKLAELEAASVWKQGEIKAFQSDLTYVLREYLENRFGLAALESTTGEIDRQIDRVPAISSWRASLIKLLQMADMVKFAKAIPDEAVHPEGLRTVRSFVEETQYVAPVADEEE